MDWLVQLDSIRDIDTQDILGCGTIHNGKGAPSCPSLLPLHATLMCLAAHHVSDMCRRAGRHAYAKEALLEQDMLDTALFIRRGKQVVQCVYCMRTYYVLPDTGP